MCTTAVPVYWSPSIQSKGRATTSTLFLLLIEPTVTIAKGRSS